MCPEMPESPSHEQCCALSDDVQLHFSLENSIITEPKPEDGRHSTDEPNVLQQTTNTNYSANLYRNNATQAFTSEANDQINLHQVAIDEAASEQQFLPFSSSSISPSPRCSCSPISPVSCSSSVPSIPRSFSHQHECDSFPTKHLLSSNHCSSYTAIASSLSISSIFKYFTSPNRAGRGVPTLQRVPLLCLLILNIIFLCVQAMSMNTYTCCIPVLSLVSLFSCLLLFSRTRFNYALLLIGFVLITATVKVDALGSSQTNQHSMHDVHSTPYNSESVHKRPSAADDKPVSGAELEMLKLLGFESRPKPHRNHKVPQYLLDLYFWFRQTQMASNREKQRIRDEAEEQSKDLGMLRSPITALTHSDLDDVHRYQEHLLAELLADEEEARFVEMIHQHHRLDKVRQPAQAPRVSLTGPVNSILSHKLKDHDDHTVDRRAIPIRRKRDTTTSSTSDNIEAQLLSKPATNEAHLTFDLRLPSGEHLKGGELRLYRHGVKNETQSNTSSANDPKPSDDSLYLPLHWSLRWKSEKNLFSPFPSKSNSLGNKKAITSSVNEEQFLQRISIYHLIRPIQELHIIRAEHHARPDGNDSVRLNIGRVMRLIDTQVIDVRHSGWLSFDIFPAASVWASHPEQNFGLLVALTDVQAKPSKHGRLIVVNKRESPPSSSVQSFQKAGDETLEKKAEQEQDQDDDDQHNDWHRLQPHVVSFSANEKHFGDYINQFGKADYDSNRLKREWRDAPGSMSARTGTSSRRQTTRKRKRQRKACSRQPLFFDFNSVGWNEFVVAPPGFQTFFCAGSCVWPLTTHHNYTNHATIQGILNSHNPTTMPAPCCVPTDLTPRTLLTVDSSGGIHLRTFPDLVVEGCGCL